MAYFFSERMTFCEALLPQQIAWDVFNQLGEMHIIALQSNIINYDNPFIKSYRRCDQTLAKITMIRNMLAQYHHWMQFTIKEVTDQRTVWEQFKHRITQSKMEGYLYINHLQEDMLESHLQLSNQLHQMESLSKRVTEVMLEMGLLITVAKENQFKSFYGGSERLGDNFSGELQNKSNMFESKVVCISRKDLMMLKKSIFRITRGNSWIYQLQINMDELNRYFTSQKHRKLTVQTLSNKIACLIIFQKGERNILQTKINRFLGCLECHILSAQINNLRSQLPKMEKKINDIEAMQELTMEGLKKHIVKLTQVREGSTISWVSYVQLYTKKQRQIYRALSTAHVSKNLIRFNLYIPSKQLPLNIHPKPNLPPLILNIKDSQKMPPSKFDTNQVLEVPQQIVNTYGVPSYEEINPAPFYIITFGFFIGVMFGDVGHMLMAIPLLIYFKANIWFWTVIFFMGYCGIIYNQFFGLNLGLFSSCYEILDPQQTGVPYHTQDCVYPIGVDSIWKVADNQMGFTNSLKMKAAVILGVTHMMFGLLLKLYNNIRQRKWIDVFTLTIPQLIFLSCTFVYMDYLIIYKWNQEYTDSKTAPSIISTMIAVFVNMAKYSQKDLLFWPDQRNTQKIIITLAAITVPIMLVAKTLIIYCQRRKAKSSHSSSHLQLQQLAQEHFDQEIQLEEMQNQKLTSDKMRRSGVSSAGNLNIKRIDEYQHEQLQQIAVHQIIQTIQFVLGSVSNTASYLRLWALSLAHAQLSQVIFELTVLKMLQGGYSNLLGLFIVFPFFFATTFGVLICMDSLQCFLHSLRLHWVEFQNKFYQGKGYLFQPFSFKKLKLK